jgi:chemotaxis response regulator CheB
MNKRGAVAIVASAGGIGALVDFVHQLRPAFPLPIFVAQHLPRAPSCLDAVLARHSPLRVAWAAEGDCPDSGGIYLVPPGMSMRVLASGLELSALAPPSSSWLASGDRLIESMVGVHGSRSIGIVLSGMLPAAVSGLRTIRAAGGFTLAQSRLSSGYFDMPAAAIDFGKADIILPPARMTLALGIIADSWRDGEPAQAA